MFYRMRRWRLPAALSVFPILSCVFETSQPFPGSDRRLDYQVQVAGKDKSGCRVEIRIRSWPDAGPRIFQAPKFYSDNPALPVPGYHASDFSVADSRGNALEVRDTLLPDLTLDGNFIVMPAAAATIAYNVDLDPAHGARFGLPAPGVGAGVDLIDGAYFFLLPLVGTDFSSQWRTPLDIRLEFLPAPGRVLVGSDARISLRDNYELMFVRAAYDPLTSSTFTMRNHEVTTYTTARDSMDLARFNVRLEKYILLVEDSLRPLPTYHYFVGENPVFAGIEGVQGYWFRAEYESTAVVQVHELIHTMVGIYDGDLDDPWWKEGLTDYLGNLLPLQAGMITDSDFAKEVVPTRDAVPAVLEYALSAPYVRNHLFAPLDSLYNDKPYPENFIQLVYGKGAQASMILDRYILEHSGGRSSVSTLVRDLNRLHSPAFHRSDWVALVNGYTRSDASGFIHDLFDQAAPIHQDSLDRTYAALKAIGRFAPGVKPAAKAAAASGRPGAVSGPHRFFQGKI